MFNDFSEGFEFQYEVVRGFMASGLLLNAINAAKRLHEMAVTEFEQDVATVMLGLLLERLEDGKLPQEYGSEN